MTVTIYSKDLRRSVTLAARGGYVYANRAAGAPCDQQVFDRDGSAYRVEDEDGLRIIAQRYIARFTPDALGE